MGDPELHSDEKILLTTQDVFVKSIPFEAILTNKRIILIDRKKNLIPQKDILLATVGDVIAAENAIRDQTITLSLITSSGETRQLVLTFSRTAGGGRKRERDDWVKTLKNLTSSSIQKTIRKVVPTFEPEPRRVEKEPKRMVVEQAPARIEITSRPGPRKDVETASRPGTKKEIETAHPIKTIVEPASMPVKPIETSSLPSGAFCTRCGNRVPPESVFCNRCGSRIIPSEDKEKPVEKPLEKLFESPPERPAAEPAVPQVAVESSIPSPKVVAPERRERPIEREIQSIEPLIEGSVPRRTEAPPVPSWKPAEPAPEQSPAATPESVSIAQAAQSIIDAVTPQPAASPWLDQAGAPSPGSTEAAGAAIQQAPSGIPPASPPPAMSGPPRKSRKAATIIIGIVVILAIACAAFLYWNYLSGENGLIPSPTEIPTETPTLTATMTTRTPVPTTVTTIETTAATPTQVQVLIPESGVWIRVTYANMFEGTVGLAGSQQEVGGTGDKFYMVPTSGGIVEASLQKMDGSGEELLVRIYKDGDLVQSGSSTAPRGVVEIQADLRPKTTATTATPAVTETETTEES